ncbi:tetratricopeptide repeat protein [Patescibacteria group bacterium]|nr:tetratricopeptide repeat protein [Patescibacteria group bacterium]MBU1922439.1 tetratricopeptide repeat protein [Patescibacteria group bacterium]
MIYWISLIIIIISAAVIAIIAARKFSRLAIIDLGTMPSEKEAQVKNRLILHRIARKSRERGEPLVKIWKSFAKKIDERFDNLYKKVQNLEKRYATERRISKPSKIKPGTDAKVRVLLNEASEFFSENKFPEAEAKFIEILSLDHHNVDAYRGLAQIYLETKQLEQAKETLDFIIKLRKDDDKTYAMHGEIAYLEGSYNEAKEYYLIAIAQKSNVVNYYLDLAKIYAALNDFQEAEKLLIKAKEIEPKNPKILDALVENSVILGNKDAAVEFYEEFKLLNPENPKLQEWKKKIDAIK